MNLIPLLIGMVIGFVVGIVVTILAILSSAKDLPSRFCRHKNIYEIYDHPYVTRICNECGRQKTTVLE